MASAASTTIAVGDSDEVLGVFLGTLRSFGKITSAYQKEPVAGPVVIEGEGLAGDQHGKGHGGADRGIMVFARSNYAALAERCGDQVPGELFAPPGLSENISVASFDERKVCFGDVFQLGSCKVRVTQPRKPCPKVSTHFGDSLALKAATDMQMSGYFVRVVEPGTVQAGDRFVLLERHFPEWPMERFMREYYATTYAREDLEALLALPDLPEHPWRKKAKERLRSMARA